MAFESRATNLDPADVDAVPDVYVKNLRTGDLVLASTSDTGVKGNGWSSAGALSADGSKVVFWSSADNLDPADTDTEDDVYLKDLTTGDIVLVSTSEAGEKGNGASRAEDIAADGSKVVFTSRATNLVPGDDDDFADLYVKDLTTGDIVLASTSDTGVKGRGESHFADLSADGRKLAFSSTAANLDPADRDVDSDVYVKDLITGDIVLASTSDWGGKGNQSSHAPSLSSDGTVVAFRSFATNFEDADPDYLADVYVKHLPTGDLKLASTSRTGAKGNDLSGYPSLSADGRKVAFDSYASNLEARDADSVRDVFVKDLAAEEVTLVSISETGQKGNLDTQDPVLSEAGTVAAVSFASNLDPGDADDFMDIYAWDVPPVAVGDSYRTPDNAPWHEPAPGVLANDTAPWDDDDDLTATLESGPTHGDVALLGDGSFTYTPDQDFTGTDSFTYRAHSGDFSSAPATVTMTIYSATVIAIDDVSQDEGDRRTTEFRFNVTLDEATSTPVTVKYRTFDGTAVSPYDYGAVSGSLTFAPGQTTQTIVVQVVGDTKIENDEHFSAWLSKPLGAVIIDELGSGWISNDDG